MFILGVVLLSLGVGGVIGDNNFSVEQPENSKTVLISQSLKTKEGSMIKGENKIAQLNTSILDNKTFVNSIFNFLSKSQDKNGTDIPSMDLAFYIGMSLKYLADLENITTEKTSVTRLKSQIMAFVAAARNQDGGYGNWKNAKSTMESTYQALMLLSAYDQLRSFSYNELNQTVSFIESLKTSSGGYYPIPNWDAPDITSTYRAVYLQKLISGVYSNITFNINKTQLSQFILAHFKPPIFIGTGSGYAEVLSGPPELLASLYAEASFQLLNITDPNAESVAKFLTNLIASNGGVAGRSDGLPTTGFTAAALKLYMVLRNTTVDLDNILPSSFVENAINYLKAVKEANSGFTSSERDSTAEIRSTFLVLDALIELKENNITISPFDLTGVLEFLVNGRQPTFGIGEYPGDVPDVSSTAKAIITGRILGNLSWLSRKVKTFIESSYVKSKGGYGFRPGGKAFVKYTYYAIKALRALNDPLIHYKDIINFMYKSQNDDGGFGQNPRAKLSYLTHTYWALSSLRLLNGLNDERFNKTLILSWLSKVQRYDGTFSNFPGYNVTLTSFYRGVQLLLLLKGNLTEDEKQLYATSLLKFQTKSGGFLPSLEKTVPTMEATYYGLQLALQFNLTLNWTQVSGFILSLRNEDGGFALRPQFSSRITSTYFAILALNLLERLQQKEKENLSWFPPSGEEIRDIWAPIITPAFVPGIDTNKTIQGSYITTARIFDSESQVNQSWVEFRWLILKNNIIYENISYGRQKVDLKDNSTWIFVFGPFDKNGIVLFRIHAQDANGNEAVTEWYQLKTAEIAAATGGEGIDTVRLLLILLPSGFLLFAGVNSLNSYKISVKNRKRGIKMKFEIDKGMFTVLDENFNLILLLLLITVISTLSRLFLGQAILVLQHSVFLFRFLLGIWVILMAKYVLGTRTLGLFAPTVLVIVMLQDGPVWGLIVFLNIFVLAYIVRMLINPYNLAVGFRIGILMTFVICYIGFLEIAGEILRIEFLSDSILVPIIITPWFADRYVTELEQSGQLDAFQRLFYTILVTLGAYVVMSFDPLVYFVTLNPETWIILAGSLFFFGKTRSYTFFDKKRFKKLFQRNKDPLTILVRNRNYIAKYNDSVLFPLINKFSMKEQFEKWDVPTANLLGIISSEDELQEFLQRLTTEPIFKKGFAIKPANSFGGKGILVIDGMTDDGLLIMNNEKYHLNALKEHILKIIQGEFLTSHRIGENDIALIEEKIEVSPELKRISVGLPDIRIIVFRGLPVMAMARLPTKESNGKANLKQGAIGAAIRMTDGTIFRSEWKGQEVNIHPDTKERIVGFRIKSWKEILATACLAQKSSGLGYTGVDIVVDTHQRILVLEVNKRPGLEIQNINASSLLERFKLVEELNLDGTKLSPLKCATLGMELAEKYWEVDTRV